VESTSYCRCAPESRPQYMCHPLTCTHVTSGRLHEYGRRRYRILVCCYNLVLVKTRMMLVAAIWCTTSIHHCCNARQIPNLAVVMASCTHAWVATSWLATPDLLVTYVSAFSIIFCYADTLSFSLAYNAMLVILYLCMDWIEPIMMWPCPILKMIRNGNQWSIGRELTHVNANKTIQRHPCWIEPRQFPALF